MKNCLIIIPTYNEAGNIERLIEAVQQVNSKLKSWKLDILIADDFSPDNTSSIVRKLQKKYKNIKLSQGQKAGLGKAYIRAMRYGLAQKKYDAFALMDADFSHDPEALPELLAEIDKKNDYVIGSRYISGGKIDGWTNKRKFNSYAANFLARVLIDMKHDVRDMTGGYKALRVSTLENINLNELRASGYVFQVNLLHEFSRRGYRISEIPITFSDRQVGASKMRLRDVLEFIYLTYRLNPESRARRMIRFALVGASGTVVNLLVLTILVNFTKIPVLLAEAIAIEVSIISNFCLNHMYTFRAAYTSPRLKYRETWRSILNKLLRYNVIALGGAGISFTVFVIAYKGLHLHYIPADLIAIIVAMGWNYWLSVRLVWKVVDEI